MYFKTHPMPRGYSRFSAALYGDLGTMVKMAEGTFKQLVHKSNEKFVRETLEEITEEEYKMWELKK